MKKSTKKKPAARRAKKNGHGGGGRRNPLYNFDELTRKGSSVVIKSVDSKVRAAAHAHGVRHGFKVRTTYTPDRTAITVTRQ